jgi:MarR family transcriptional regulator, transcriptional regulator for hemolysin
VPSLPAPIGRCLTITARVVSRAFDAALAEAGGSLPVWLVLLNVKFRRPANQRDLAETIKISEATLTHHLDTMDIEGLITRRRDTANRRIHVVELTEAGEESFLRLRRAALAFDQRLRIGITNDDLASLERLLDRLARNMGTDEESAQWSGLLATTP